MINFIKTNLSQKNTYFSCFILPWVSNLRDRGPFLLLCFLTDQNSKGHIGSISTLALNMNWDGPLVNIIYYAAATCIWKPSLGKIAHLFAGNLYLRGLYWVSTILASYGCTDWVLVEA